MQAKNYVKRTETLAVKSGSKVSWELTPDFGWVTVMSEPPGLDVKIDDNPAGKTPLNRQEVSIGPHEVLVSSPCHYDAGERINVERGEERCVDASLAPKVGAIDVSAKDEKGNALEADVYVDGEKVGRTPGVYKVSVCAKEVEVRHDRHGALKKSVSVREKQVVRVEARLEAAARKKAEEVAAKKAADAAAAKRAADAKASDSGKDADKAKKYMKLGISAHKKGSHALAIKYFEKAQAYADDPVLAAKWIDKAKQKRLERCERAVYVRQKFGFNRCEIKSGPVLKGVSEMEMVRMARKACAVGFAYHAGLKFGSLIVGTYPMDCRSPANESWPLYLVE